MTTPWRTKMLAKLADGSILRDLESQRSPEEIVGEWLDEEVVTRWLAESEKGTVPTKSKLLALMAVCVCHKDTSWFYEWNLIHLHDAIHRYYDINEHEQDWFNQVSDVHGEADS